MPGSCELVRSCWEAVAAGDHDALIAACDPGVVWDLSRLAGWSGDAVAHGHDGVRAVLSAGHWTCGATCISLRPRVLLELHPDAASATIHELQDGWIVRLDSITGRRASQLAFVGTTDPIPVVEAAWGAWDVRDMDRVMACFSEDVIFDLSHYAAWRGASLFQGSAAVMRFLAEWMLWWHGYDQEVLEIEAQDRDVLVSFRHHGQRDGAFVDEVAGVVFAVRPDGIMDHWTLFDSPEDARAWLALRQAPAEAQ